MDVALRLVLHTKSCCRKFPKSAMFITTTDLIHTANEIGKHIVQANARYPNTEWDVEYRRGHLQEARGLLDWLDFGVQQAYELYHGVVRPIEDGGTVPKDTKIKVSDYGWEEWGRLIYKAKNLVDKVMASDRSRLKK